MSACEERRPITASRDVSFGIFLMKASGSPSTCGYSRKYLRTRVLIFEDRKIRRSNRMRSLVRLSSVETMQLAESDEFTGAIAKVLAKFVVE